MASKQEQQDLWDSAWGEVDYFSHQFAGMMSMMDAQLGEVVVDIGSGATPVTQLLDRRRHKIIEIDIASDEKPDLPNTLRLRFDIEDAIDENKNTTRAAIGKVGEFLGIDCENRNNSPQKLEQVDTFVFSQILNYVDFKAVIKALKKYLKPGGQIILNECFGLAIGGLRSEAGISNFEELAEFLRDEGYEPSEPMKNRNRLLWRLRKPRNQDPIAEANRTIMEILENIYKTGGNDFEFGAIREILNKLNSGEITPEDAVTEAGKIRDSKMDYH